MTKKVTKKKALWVRNNTGSDVSLSDLGVKVLANKTINVYAYNPYLIKDKVDMSRLTGSLAKRLESGVLVVVKGTKNPKPHTLDHIKASSDSVVVRSKSAVFVNTKEEDVLEDGDLGDIADYGLGDLGHSNTINVRTEDGSIVVEQRKNYPEDEVSDAWIRPKKIESNVSGQSIIAMTKQAESQSNPVGTMAESSSPPDQPFVVINPSKDPEPQQATALQEADEKLKNTNKAKKRIKKVNSAFVVDGKISGRNPEVLAASEGEKEIADADSVIKEEATYDAKVATKDESGVIVMKVKEVAKEPEPKVEKPKAVKVTKAKKKTRKKKTK